MGSSPAVFQTCTDGYILRPSEKHYGYRGISGKHQQEHYQNAGKIANFIYLTPFLSLIFIRLILHEKLYYTSLIGLCLIIGGILVGKTKKGRIQKNLMNFVPYHVGFFELGINIYILTESASAF